MTTRTVEGGPGVTGMVKAALPVLPILKQLPGVRKTGSELPDLECRRSATVDAGHVAAYSRVCGFPVKDVAPVPYLHMVAFPLHLAILTDSSFPFPAMGLVHLENVISQHRPVRAGETVEVSVRAADLRAHARGRIFDMRAEARVGDEPVWSSTSTYLRRGPSPSEEPDPGMSLEQVPAGGIPWRLPADLGRRYAAVSGDHNPIHLYPLTAKALGFPRQIAHGMWSKARCIAALENRLPDAVRVEVAFKKPILLPGTVSFGARQSGRDFEFSLSGLRGGTPHLLGRTVGL